LQIPEDTPSLLGLSSTGAGTAASTMSGSLASVSGNDQITISVASSRHRRAAGSHGETEYFAKSRLGRTKSDPADARSLAEMAMREQPVARDALEGVELRQAARFAMTLVTEQARVCQRLIRLVELGFPELGELFEDPACRTAREVLRIAPTAAVARRRRTSTLADANIGAGHRRLGESKAERLKAAADRSIAVPELDDEVAFEISMLLDQYDLLARAKRFSALGRRPVVTGPTPGRRCRHQ